VFLIFFPDSQEKYFFEEICGKSVVTGTFSGLVAEFARSPVNKGANLALVIP
jgi:hypothetical protein